MRRAVLCIAAAAPLLHGEPPPGVDCVVCGDPLADPGCVVSRTACGHLFCRGCIWRWLEANARCPLCNHDLALGAGAVLLPGPVRREPGPTLFIPARDPVVPPGASLLGPIARPT